MSIISGYKKFKKHIKTNEGFQLQSLWTNANTVEADDKRTMQTKVGAINGISSSETANSGEIAASTALTNKMNGSINQLSRDFETQLPDDVRIIHEGSGVDVKYYAQLGADTASKKLLGNPLGEDYDIIHFGWMVYRLHGYNYQYVFSDSAVFSVDADKDKAHCRLIAKQTVTLHVEMWNGGPHQGAEHSVGDFKFRLITAGFYCTDSITLTPGQIIDINLAWGDSHTAAQVMVIRDK